MHVENVDILGVQSEIRSALDSQTVVIVCAADDNYAMPLAVTMRSAIENIKTDRRIFFYVIDGGITDFNKRKILKSLRPEKCEVEFLEIPEMLVGDLENAHLPLASQVVSTKAEYVSIASFYRLIIPELLPERVEKVIYLDCDLIVKGDVSQLWQVDLGDNYVLAVHDTWIPSISSPTGRLNYQELGIDPDARYFNAGVLVVNLKKWRADKFSTKAIDYFKQHLESIGWYDQGLLNALLVGQWGQLDSRWNFNATSFYDYNAQDYLAWENSESFLAEDIYTQVVREPYIIHYVSSKKPWTSRHCPRKEDFFEYVDLTAWSGWRLTIWKRLQRRLVSEFKTAIGKINLDRQ